MVESSVKKITVTFSNKKKQQKTRHHNLYRHETNCKNYIRNTQNTYLLFIADGISLDKTDGLNQGIKKLPIKLCFFRSPIEATSNLFDPWCIKYFLMLNAIKQMLITRTE